jgi:hypothetical protein
MLLGLRIEGGEMSRTCSKHYGVSIAYTFSVGKFLGKTRFGDPELSVEKMLLKQTSRYEEVDCLRTIYICRIF